MSDSVQERSPDVIGVNSEDADALIGALSSQTARDILQAIHDTPSTPSEIAEEVDTTVQNVRYHIDNLQDAELIDVNGTRYSEKGREMKVYSPARPLVVFVGGDDDSSALRDALTRTFAGLLALGFLAAAVEFAYRSMAPTADDAAPVVEQDTIDAPAFEVERAPTADAPEEVTPTLAERALELASPGVLFFLGGAVVMLTAFVYWYRTRRSD